jgi:hypothetical protein
MTDVIIPAAGSINHKIPFLKSIFKSPCLIPIHSKPVFYYINKFYKQRDVRINLLIDEEVEDIVRHEFMSFEDFIRIQTVRDTFGVNDTLEYAITNYKYSEDIIVNLVTTIPLTLVEIDSFLVDEKVDHMHTISKVVEIGNGVKFFGKNDQQDQVEGRIFTGVFRTSKINIEKALRILEDKNDLLKLVEVIHENYSPFKALENTWIDVGHEFSYYEARKKLLTSRVFNNVKVDETRGVLKKESTDKVKLFQEYNYLKMLPDCLRIIYPRTSGQLYENSDSVGFEMEYYGYPNLSEYLLYWDLDKIFWKNVFQNLQNIIELFKVHKYSVGYNAFESFYNEKTERRLQIFYNQLNETGIYKNKSFIINGEQSRNYDELRPLIEEKIKTLYDEDHFCVMHGDICFNNILYDHTSGIIRLIDQRGSFGAKCVGIYGDQKYDLAKLIHSSKFYYDFIVNDLFSIKFNNNFSRIDYSFVERNNTEYISSLSDEIINNLGYNKQDIEFIVGLLFLSMTPLHNDKFERQITMYFHGLRLIEKSLK